MSVIEIQHDLFVINRTSRVPVSAGWFICPDAKTTAENQLLVFDLPGVVATHDSGQRSKWLLNGIDKIALCIDGDQSRIPSKALIENASHILVELTNSGRLFPQEIGKVIYANAWSKGADAAFNGQLLSSNMYAFGTVQFDAWRDGWFSH